MIKYPCRGCGKAVGNNHRAIECDICHAWIHIKCNKFDDNDYKFFQDNPSAPFYCIICSSENIPFSSLNNNLFSIAVEKGVNFLADTDVLTLSDNEQQLFNKINRAINNNALIGNDADDFNTDDIDDHTLDCKYYSIDEFQSCVVVVDKILGKIGSCFGCMLRGSVRCSVSLGRCGKMMLVWGR